MNQFEKKLDPVIVTTLEMVSKERAVGNETGIACSGDICVRYYPVSGRYAWFDDRGPCTKRVAVWKLGARP